MDEDQKCFVQLAGRCMPGLLEHLMRMVGSRPDAVPEALRLAQVVMSDAWTRRIHVRGEVVFRVWLYRSASNRFLDMMRKLRPQAEARNLSTWLNDTSGLDPEAWKLVTEEDVQAAVDSLEPKHRDVFKAHSEGATYQELARRLGEKVGMIGRYLVEARRQLLQRIQDIARSRQGGGTPPAGASSTPPPPEAPPPPEPPPPPEAPRPPDEDSP